MQGKERSIFFLCGRPTTARNRGETKTMTEDHDHVSAHPFTPRTHPLLPAVQEASEASPFGLTAFSPLSAMALSIGTYVRHNHGTVKPQYCELKPKMGK